ncbi:lysophospholipid acyltransferase family protein [Sphingomonas montanisoli]|uniref:1-acyl-sn-glycerol-3-phosphate acyltransferase n=1 Tax=Sphingomonas montanisoli TaxID=2606412 RepID=A0A5D9CAC2_9SPHN|nr:lysophospholipid acyltransferase family protein [Sphingomonas montanisoli]TZG28010.1 1-acyl-sn-glycerol-3-phosphate acyltransferase [Sphingomonas montanisoli]
MSRKIRTGWRVGLLLGLLLVCLVGYGVSRLFGPGHWWKRTFLHRAGGIIGLDLRIEGTPLPNNVLLIANHVSWLDILAIGGAAGARFVSKAEVANWPVVGMIARIGDTVLVERQSKRAVRGQADQLSAALSEGRPVVLFPEGTTGDGRALLPFRPALLATVTPPPSGIAVQPVAIDYGDATADVAWPDGESMGVNAARVVGRRGRIRATVRFLPPLPPIDDRKALAAAAQAAIAEALSGA